MKRLIILGSTGSIGTQTLEVVRDNSGLQVFALVAGTSVETIEMQIREFRPRYACMWTKEAADDLRSRLKDVDITILAGMEGMIELVSMDEYDILVTAIVGMIGIRPTVAAIKKGKTIALANKETLVTAGSIIMPLAKQCGADILPVDSEHSAIFQSLNGENGKNISRILLTASGGPFRGRKREELADITVKDALKHPNWSMGPKITVDSASMVNKGLEVIEAKWLFGVDIDKVKVLVHPESILHSAVEFTDGAVIGQMGVPDMKLPIQYAIFYPDRRPMKNNKLDLFKVASLNFEEPDMEVFRGLKLAIKVGNEGGTLPTVFNAANEKAVALFLKSKIRFLDIYDIIEDAVSRHKNISEPTLEDILNTETETYDYIKSKYNL